MRTQLSECGWCSSDFVCREGAKDRLNSLRSVDGCVGVCVCVIMILQYIEADFLCRPGHCRKNLCTEMSPIAVLREVLHTRQSAMVESCHRCERVNTCAYPNLMRSEDDRHINFSLLDRKTNTADISCVTFDHLFSDTQHTHTHTYHTRAHVHCYYRLSCQTRRKCSVRLRCGFRQSHTENTSRTPTQLYAHKTSTPQNAGRRRRTTDLDRMAY